MTSASRDSTTWSSSVANPLQDLFARRVAGSSGIVDWLARASSMGQLRHTVGCGSNEQCSQSVRQADTVRCGHAASSLCELVAVLEFSTVRYCIVLSHGAFLVGTGAILTRLHVCYHLFNRSSWFGLWPQVFSQGEYLHITCTRL